MPLGGLAKVLLSVTGWDQMAPQRPCLRKETRVGEAMYVCHMGLQDEAVNVERDCGACQCGVMSQREESGQKRCDVMVDFLNGFQFKYGESENLEVASLESCQLVIGPSTR